MGVNKLDSSAGSRFAPTSAKFVNVTELPERWVFLLLNR
jgi:hypothetical protein